MELRHLRSFCVVAEELHVTRAAKRLHIAQPALTQQIQALEADLEVRLLRRIGRGIQLTEAGRYFQKEAEALLQRARNIRLRTREIGSDGAGCLAVALTDTVSLAPAVTRLLNEFKRRWPGIQISLETRLPSELSAALKDGAIDIGFSCPHQPEISHVAQYCFEKVCVLLAVPAFHPLAGKRSVSLAAMKDQPIVLVTREHLPLSFEEKLRTYCSKMGFEPRVVQEAPDVMLALNFVAAGLGVSLVPDNVRGFHSEAINYIPLRPPDLLALRLTLMTRAADESVQVNNLRALALSLGEGSRMRRGQNGTH